MHKRIIARNLNQKQLDFNGLLTDHLDKIVLFANLMHNFFIKSIVFLYMFRALLRPSSGGLNCTGLFISPSGISELDCATTKTDTAERSISIGRESLQVFFLY